MGHPQAACAIAVALCAAGALTAAQSRPSSADAAAKALTVALTDVSVGKIPYIVAHEEGLFTKHGVAVRAFITANAARTIADSGTRANPDRVRDIADPDVNTGGGSPMMVGATTDVRQRGRIILATTENTVRWWVLAAPGITTLEQLKGKRLGVSGYGTCTGFMARLIAQRMGWHPEQDLSILFGALGVRWLQEGAVDAIVADDTHNAYAVSIGLKPLVGLAPWKVPIPCDSISVKRSWLEQPGNRDRMTRFLRATIEAIALIKRDRAAADRAIGKWYGITDPVRLRVLYEGAQHLPSKPYPAVDGIRKVMELYDYHEMRRHKAEEFYDDSLVREIDGSGFIDALYK